MARDRSALLMKPALLLLLAGSVAAPASLAQTDAAKEKRWAIRAYCGAGGTGTSEGPLISSKCR